MKKIILSLVLLFCVFNLNAQNSDILNIVTKILDSNGGIISKSKELDEKTYMILADLPSYISFDIFSSSCKFILLDYDNVLIKKCWTKDEDDLIISKYLINDRKLNIVYDNQEHCVGFSFEKD